MLWLVIWYRGLAEPCKGPSQADTLSLLYVPDEGCVGDRAETTRCERWHTNPLDPGKFKIGREVLRFAVMTNCAFDDNAEHSSVLVVFFSLRMETGVWGLLRGKLIGTYILVPA